MDYAHVFSTRLIQAGADSYKHVLKLGCHLTKSMTERPNQPYTRFERFCSSLARKLGRLSQDLQWAQLLRGGRRAASARQHAKYRFKQVPRKDASLVRCL